MSVRRQKPLQLRHLLLRRRTVAVYEVQLTFAVEADDADQAAEAFGDWIGMSKTVEVAVRNLDTGADPEFIDIRL